MYIKFGCKDYKEVKNDEIIKEGAIHTWEGSAPNPIVGRYTIGKTPSEFAKERTFYNLLDEPRYKVDIEFYDIKDQDFEEFLNKTSLFANDNEVELNIGVGEPC